MRLRRLSSSLLALLALTACARQAPRYAAAPQGTPSSTRGCMARRSRASYAVRRVAQVVPVAATFDDGPYTLEAATSFASSCSARTRCPTTTPSTPQGQVSLPLVGAIEARGLTTAQLGSAIAGRLKSGYVRDPSVAVEIETYRPFFVLGEVTYPGQYPYVPNMTVENAIAIAGGFTPRASRDKVTITRKVQGVPTRIDAAAALSAASRRHRRSLRTLVLISLPVVLRCSRRNPTGRGVMRAVRFIVLLFGLVCGPLPAAAAADKYPSRPIKFVVGFLAGGPNDTIARIFCEWLQPHLGQPCVVENKAGQGGMIAAKSVINSPPDGYTIMFVAPNNAIGQTLYKNLPFNHRARHRAGRRHHAACQHHGGAAVAAGEDRRRVHRLHQSQSRQGQLRLVRQRHFGAHVGRAVQDDDQARHAARALSRLGRHLSRSHDRQGPCAVRQHAGRRSSS